MGAMFKIPFYIRDPYSSRPIKPYKFQANLILCDSTFTVLMRAPLRSAVCVLLRASAIMYHCNVQVTLPCVFWVLS